MVKLEASNFMFLVQIRVLLIIIYYNYIRKVIKNLIINKFLSLVGKAYF